MRVDAMVGVGVATGRGVAVGVGVHALAVPSGPHVGVGVRRTTAVGTGMVWTGMGVPRLRVGGAEGV
jgi:hypothetical protein